MLQFTHIYTILYKTIAVIVFLLLVGLVYEIPDMAGISNAPIVVQFVVFIGCCIGVMYLIKRLAWIPTYLYVRNTLSTEVNPSEAKQLSFLFDDSLKGKWYALLEIKDLKPESRKQALFEFASKVAGERR
jgi:hypothetical protein